jgi:hypothetical protein
MGAGTRDITTSLAVRNDTYVVGRGRERLTLAASCASRRGAVPLGRSTSHPREPTPDTGPAADEGGLPVNEPFPIFGMEPTPAMDGEEWSSVPPRQSLHRRPVVVGVAAAAVLALGAIIYLLTANEIGTHDQLHAARASLRQTRSDLASTMTDLTQTSNELARANQQVSADQSKINSLQGSLSATQQLTVDIAGVTGQLKSCVNDSQQFESDMTTAEITGDYTAAFADAGTADAVCAQANSDFDSLAAALTPSSST